MFAFDALGFWQLLVARAASGHSKIVTLTGKNTSIIYSETVLLISLVSRDVFSVTETFLLKNFDNFFLHFENCTTHDWYNEEMNSFTDGRFIFIGVSAYDSYMDVFIISLCLCPANMTDIMAMYNTTGFQSFGVLDSQHA